MSAANISDFEFVSSVYVNEDENPFVVDSFEGTEELGRPFRFEINVSSKNKNILIQKILNGYAKLIIHEKSNNNTLSYNGVIAEVEVLEDKDEKVLYKFILVPEFWRISLAKSTRFYAKKDQSILAVINCAFECAFEKNAKQKNTKINFDLLDESCYTSVDAAAPEDQSKRFRFTHRDYVLQYEESYFDFIHRWLEKEGIYYFIKSLDDFSVEIIFVDSIYKIPRDSISVNDSKKLTQKIKSLPRVINLKDYNREKASADLQASAVVDEDGVGSIDIFGENFRNEDEGNWYAKVCADILKSQAYSYSRSSSLIGVKSGFFAKLNSHDEEYLITKVKHYGFEKNSQAQNNNESEGDHDYKCDFEALYYEPDQSQEFRCQKITPKPVISGNLIAFICGVYALNKVDYIKGEEKNDKNKYKKNDIETEDEKAERIAKENADYANYVENNLNKDEVINSLDSEGFYSVEFKSVDIIDTSNGEVAKSIKMRLATPYAGFDHGMHFPLIKGTEVLISFTNGDPDLPVIFSAVNNSLSPSISTEKNYQDNIIQTKTGNKIILRDSKDKRGIVLAVPSLDNNKHYDVVQNFSPGEDPSQSSAVDVVTGKKFSNFLGGSFSLSAGTSSSISASLSSSISLSSSMSLSAGISNNINLGSMGIKWSPKLFDSFEDTSISLGDGGKSFNYGKDAEVIETKRSFEIKTGAIDNSFDKQELKVTENYLKLALQAELALDVLFAALFQKGPEVVKNNSINDVESSYKKEIDSSYLKYQQDLDRAKSVEEKYKAKEDWSLSREAAAKTRRDELKKINDSFEVDNEWGVRLTRNATRLAIQGITNLNMLSALKKYASKLKEHQAKVKAHKSGFTMDDKQIRVYQNLFPSSPDRVSNEMLMNEERFSLTKNFGESASSSIDMYSSGAGLTVYDNDGKTIQQVYLSAPDDSVLIMNDKYKINILKDKMVIGKKDGKSSVMINEEEIYFNSKTVKLNDGWAGTFSKNGVDLANGVLKILK